MKTIKNKTFDEERALYNLKNTAIMSCDFAGEKDGESALKECEKITALNCNFHLRYPLWHAKKVKLEKCNFSNTARAPIWYAKGVDFVSCNLSCVKALRESKAISVLNSTISSTEFGWRCSNLNFLNSEFTSEYFLFESKNLNLNGVTLNGKYSFQYVKNARLTNCKLYTKDAFWHAKDVVVENSEVCGEYLGWYSENLTFINCTINGTQPLCYCKNLTLINCTMENCDLSFEYSSVNADVKGFLHSVKNVKSGKVVADKIGEIINENSKFSLDAKVISRN